MSNEVRVVDEPEHHRFTAYAGDQRAGLAAYRLRDGVIEFVHTEVDDAFEGQGVGSALAREALDAVRRDGRRRVVASCPFIAGWIDRHPEYQDLPADGS